MRIDDFSDSNDSLRIDRVELSPPRPPSQPRLQRCIVHSVRSANPGNVIQDCAVKKDYLTQLALSLRALKRNRFSRSD